MERLGAYDVSEDLEGDTRGEEVRAEYGQECEFLPYAPRRSGHSYSCHGASAHSAGPNVGPLSCPIVLSKARFLVDRRIELADDVGL